MLSIDPERIARAMKRVACVGVLAAGSLAAGGPAWSFDTGPHFDITRDALSAEGFGKTAVEIAQVNNWFVDMYEKAPQNPYSGHGAIYKVILTAGINPLNYFEVENWSDDLVHAADASHFDGTDGGFATAEALNAEWDRLRRAVYRLAQAARAENDPLKLLTVLGASLHQVQDFYAHTNWVEPDRERVLGFDGPDWKVLGWGDAPTWFDIPAAVRSSKFLYTGGSEGALRGHGVWNSNSNANLATAMNKDWSGRPLYTEAYGAAYFATRQWAQAVRSWVADEAFWQRVISYSNRSGRALDHELTGAFGMSFYSGHWDGQGEPSGGDNPGPGGSLLSLRSAVKDYFEGHSKTVFRRTWENLIRQMADPNPPAPLGPVPSSQPMQRDHVFVRLQITEMSEIDNMDLLPTDDADFYARVEIAGHQFTSALIHGYDTFRFSKPNHPFTFLKAVRRGTVFPEPLANLRIEVATSNDWWSGTDDDVYLRINDSLRFKLNKPLYNDFEGGDRDTYSIPLDTLRLATSDIRYLQIEKSPDGPAGGWKLQGIKVWANDQLIYENNSINRWLEDNSRTWRATNFRPTARSGQELPVRLSLYDADSYLYFNDDHADLHPDHGRRDVVLIYNPLTGAYRGDYTGALTGVATGGDRYGGRWDDGNRARVRFRVETLAPIPANVLPTGSVKGVFPVLKAVLAP